MNVCLSADCQRSADTRQGGKVTYDRGMPVIPTTEQLQQMTRAERAAAIRNVTVTDWDRLTPESQAIILELNRDADERR